MPTIQFEDIKCDDNVEVANKLYRNNEFDWLPLFPVLDYLPETTRDYLDLMGLAQGCPKVWVARQYLCSPESSCFIFKIDDARVRYLLHDPNKKSHVWGDSRFTNLDPNWAAAYMVRRSW